MTAPTIVICAWCRLWWRPMGDETWRPVTEPVDDSKCSHGMCPGCFAVQTAPLEARKHAEVRP